MMKKINKFALLTLVFLVGCLSQENLRYKVESHNLLSKEFELLLLTPFHIQKENYEEGVIYYYSFPDSAIIIVFQGTLMELPPDKYTPIKTEIKKDRTISVGYINNKFWRKDNIKGVRVYYENVSTENKRHYDKILDKIRVTSL